jgi:2-isopropylmalate synthase
MADITVLDSTLRDGAQGGRISFSVQDKLRVAEALDELGVAYIEAGNPASNPKDAEFFQKARKLRLSTAEVVAFGSTRRKGVRCQDDAGLQSLLAAGTPCVVLFGKSSPFQVREVLGADLDENLAMIAESAAYAVREGRRVIYDAEHFFDAYKEDAAYALQTLEAAAAGGAGALALCDTKGGSLPAEIAAITGAALGAFAGKAVQIGIHAHNDSGLAVACSLAAVGAGATQVQGTLLGFGERAGNANLAAVIANLELKMGCRAVPVGRLPLLTPLCKLVAEAANLVLEAGMPYVGQNAFAHKAGMHIDAVVKNPAAYEHVPPEAVGNERAFAMSEVAGRSTIVEKIKRFAPNLTKDSAAVGRIIDIMKGMEHAGYQFDGAEGSFELLVRKTLGIYRPFFALHYYKAHSEQPRLSDAFCSFAQLKIEVGGKLEVAAGEGDGPLHALDVALRTALERFYPSVSRVRLTDYKVRVIDSRSATAAKVRVLIESSDGEKSWATVGVSSDIVEASWTALVDSFEYKLLKDAGDAQPLSAAP